MCEGTYFLLIMLLYFMLGAVMNEPTPLKHSAVSLLSRSGQHLWGCLLAEAYKRSSGKPGCGIEDYEEFTWTRMLLTSGEPDCVSALGVFYSSIKQPLGLIGQIFATVLQKEYQSLLLCQGTYIEKTEEKLDYLWNRFVAAEGRTWLCAAFKRMWYVIHSWTESIFSGADEIFVPS